MLKEARLLFFTLTVACLYNLALTPSTKPTEDTWDTGIDFYRPYPEDDPSDLPSTDQLPGTSSSLKKAWFIFTVLFLLLFVVLLLLCCFREIHKRRLSEQMKQLHLLQGHDSRVAASVRLLDYRKRSRDGEHAGGYSPGNQNTYLLARFHAISSPKRVYWASPRDGEHAGGYSPGNQNTYPLAQFHAMSSPERAYWASPTCLQHRCPMLRRRELSYYSSPTGGI